MLRVVEQSAPRLHIQQRPARLVFLLFVPVPALLWALAFGSLHPWVDVDIPRSGALVGLAMAAVAAVAAPIVLAAPSHADPDTDFANQLHTFGIYGPRDYNAWIGKITCKRLATGLDKDAYASAKFLLTNLPMGTNQGQALQFLGAAIGTYCPDQVGVLQRASVG